MTQYYQNTNPEWIPLFKEFMESQGKNKNNFNFQCEDLYYYVDLNGVIKVVENKPRVPVILFDPTMITRKEIKITIPTGYVIDEENSTFECIKFKKKELTYDDISESLFKDKRAHYVSTSGDICDLVALEHYSDLNNGTSKKQLEKLLAINKLMNIAKYFNGDWEPKFKGERAYFIYRIKGKYYVNTHCEYADAIVYFKSKKDAEQAIKILGQNDLDLIYSTDW